MPIKEDLKKALVEAAKARDQVLLDTLRSVQSAIKYKEIEKRGELTEVETFAVISTLCKQRRESVEQFQKGGRVELAAKESRELEILQKLLPAQASQEDIEKVVKKLIVETGAQGAKDMGRVIKAVMAELAGKADGKLVSDLVRSLLK